MIAMGVNKGLFAMTAAKREGRITPPRHWFIECCACGFEPDEQDSLPRGRCPKCRGHCWRRVVRPGMAVAPDSSRRMPGTAMAVPKACRPSAPSRRDGIARRLVGWRRRKETA
jgi:hypothetical protein